METTNTDSNKSPLRLAPWIMAGVTLLLGVLLSTKVALIDAEHHLSDARSQAVSDLKHCSCQA